MMMYRLVKFIWRRADQHAMQRALFEIRSLAQYHRQQAEIAALRKAEKKDDLFALKQPWRRTSKEHGAIADALYELERRLNPQPQINIAVDQAELDEKLQEFMKNG